MKTRLSILTALIAVLVAAFALPAEAKRPLVGTMDLQFNLGWPGPQADVPIWVGTVDIDGREYPMAFFNIGSGKQFDGNPNSSASFFEEIWTIYEELDVVFANGVVTSFTPGEVVLSGEDRGVATFSNLTYRMNGDVRVAEGGFEHWLGRRVHMSGEIVLGDGTDYPVGAPQFAPGEFRIN